ncbi:FG-GAP-like repeat-containing protein [Polyangium sp. y55x31]|uniref:protein kinase domain-containing protein n=1 Tax=Polyangium sp. y55x31 TaxID=3042688 RepID=UPI002482D65B|nr:FG-GAP-like repeat-containing protein [Polyangium sp. y55x31]MDI1483282.1 FG-GAP-like repeat-containing protein [Polyangium sp. y55x31]
MIRWLSALLLVLLAPIAARAAEPSTWYPVESPTTEKLSSIRFSPDGTGWVVGAKGTVLRYDGQAWHRIPGPDEAVFLNHVAPLGPEEIWAAENGGHRLYHYKDGRWQMALLDAEFVCLDVDFLHPGLGYAVGLFGMLYRYDGRSWERVHTPFLGSDYQSHLNGVAIVAANDVWVGGSTGFVLHFDGQAWQRHEAPLSTSGRLQRFEDTMALVGAPVHVKRGEEWQPLSPAWLVAIAARHGTTWGVTMDSSLVRVEKGDVERVLPGRRVDDIAEGPSGLWAIGKGGLILALEPNRLPTFVDRTFEAGVGVQAESATAWLADLDGSGGPDLLLATPFGRNSFLRAEAPGAFRSQLLATPDMAVLSDSRIAVADVDGDGWVDLLARPPGRPGERPLHLLRNLGDLRFWDAGPAAAPLEPDDASGPGELAVADLDGDSDLDVYEVRFLREPGGSPVPNVLWVNDGLGHLAPRQLAHHDGGASLAWSRGALTADLDGDGRMDLLSLNAWGEGNTFYRQAEDGRLVDATGGSGLAGAIQESLAAAAGDVNGDGALDVLLVTSERYGPSRLFRNDGRGHFHDVTSEAGLDRIFASAAGAEFGDMDLDGDLDLVVALALPRNAVTETQQESLVRLLLNDGRGAFTDVSVKTGAGLMASNILVEDFDEDGDLDIYQVRQGVANRLLLNTPLRGGWLKVRPLAPPPNRAALGARVSVYGPGGALLGVRETNVRHPVAHLGLGETNVVSVEVRFPSGRVVRRENITAGQVVEVAEVARPELWMREVVFFARHRWAWADKKREGGALLLVVAWVLGLRRLGPRLGARRWVTRWATTVGMLGVYGGLSLASMPLAPVSSLAKVLPLVVVAGLGLVVLGADRVWTRRTEARFVGPYELFEEIGRGGMGIVYRARDGTQPGQPIVALKVLRHDRVGDASSLRRFVQEAELGARLCHPGIVTVLASGECRVLEGRAWRKTAYLAMEYVEGSALSALLAGREPLPLARAVEIVRDAASALSAAHAAGVLHRDVKPDNLLLSRAGVVKLVDFGIAAVARAPAWTEAGSLVGTLAYLPPERAAGRPEDARGDLYSLGAVLYEVVCGVRPFDEATDMASLLVAVASDDPVSPRARRPDVPPRLEALLLSLLAKDPADRPASAQQTVQELDAVLRELGGQAASAPPAAAPAVAPDRVATAVGPRQAPRSVSPVSVDSFERETLDLPPSHRMSGDD